jgi:hypothetical protein
LIRRFAQISADFLPLLRPKTTDTATTSPESDPPSPIAAHGAFVRARNVVSKAIVRRTRFIAASVGSLSLAATALLFASCEEVMRASYPTAAAAQADGAIERGWLPPTLPASAFAIAESHDLDTNTGGGSFRFDPRDAASFRAKLEGMPSSPPPSGAGDDHVRLRDKGYSFYSEPGFGLAVNWQTHHAEFWLVPGSR